MRIWFNVLGAEVFSFGVRFTEKPLIVVQKPDDPEESEISGGLAGSFERDTDPLSPDDRYNWEWDDKKKASFGFEM